MNIDEILCQFKQEDDFSLLIKAWSFARGKLTELSMQRVLKMIQILLYFNVDSLTIVCCLLYETINCGSTQEEIRKEFGDVIANIIASIETINNFEKLDCDNFRIYLNENLDDSFENVSSFIIKLAERFYDLHSMYNCSIDYQKEFALNTLDIFVPVVNKLGLNSMKSKLEDLCLYYLEPGVYKEILDNLDDTPDRLNVYLNNMRESIVSFLKDNNIVCDVKCRVKSFLSIYNKLCGGRDWNDIYDILAIRIITESVDDCHKIVKLLHSKYNIVSGRFKDYINNPKENMYQSIHTTIIGDDNRFYEIQVRTHEMNLIAEEGSASHRVYKKNTSRVPKYFNY